MSWHCLGVIGTSNSLNTLSDKMADLDKIAGKTPPVFRELPLFPNLAGMIPFIFQKK